MGKSFKNIAAGAAIAGIAGYVVGLLTAPKSGKETREQVRHAGLRAKAQAERKLKHLHAELGETIAQAKEQLGTIAQAKRAELQRAIEQAERAKTKARELISAIHEGESQDADLDAAVKEVKTALGRVKQFAKK